MVSRVEQLLGGSVFRTVAVPMAEFIFFGETDGEKFRRHAFIPRTEDLGETFVAARAAGFRGKLLLAATFPGVRLESARYPDMEEEELREMMGWETDRLFRTEKPLSVDYRILSHTPEGYEILAAGCENEILQGYEAAAAESGFKLSGIFPLAPLFAGEEKQLVGIFGDKALRLYFWEGGRLSEKRRVPIAERETVAEALARYEACPSVYLPGGDCGEEAYAAWRALPAFTAAPGKKESCFAIGARLASRQGGLKFSSGRNRPFFCAEKRTLRFYQGACLLAACCAVIFCGQWIFAKRAADGERTRAAALSERRAEMEDSLRAEKNRAAMLAEARAFYQKGRIEEGFLLRLADFLPPGIVLTAIETENGRVQISGTAYDMNALNLFEKRLLAEEGRRCETELSRQPSGLLRFTLRFAAKEDA